MIYNFNFHHFVWSILSLIQVTPTALLITIEYICRERDIMPCVHFTQKAVTLRAQIFRESQKVKNLIRYLSSWYPSFKQNSKCYTLLRFLSLQTRDHNGKTHLYTIIYYVKIGIFLFLFLGTNAIFFK